MLYFVCYEKYGFATEQGNATHNVREARPFESFKEADDFGREHSQGIAYAVLANCIGKA